MFRGNQKKRWFSGNVFCCHCESKNIEKNGHHRSQSYRQLYHCKDCNKYFDDLTNTVFEGSQIN